MTRAPFLSVIIPTHNNRTHIAERLIDTYRHLEQQPYQSEVVVVDNASTDDTNSIVERFQSLLPNLHHVRLSTRQSLGSATRHGLLMARGKWRAISNPTQATPIIECNKILPHAADGHSLFATPDYSLLLLSAKTVEKLSAESALTRCTSYSSLVRHAAMHRGQIKFIPIKYSPEHLILAWMYKIWYTLATIN